MLGPVSLNGLATFLAVADQLSFSAAAETLGVSRATISAQVAELERHLGVRLLQRTTRKVSLTEAGMAYRDRVGDMMGQIRDAERIAMSFQTEAIGRIRISSSFDFSQRYLLPLISEFLQANPKVSIELRLSQSAVNLVEEGIDLAIRGTLSVEPNLVTRQVGRSPLLICAAAEYLRQHGTPERPEQLIDHACLHFAGLRWGRNWVMRRAGQEIRAPVRPSLEVNDGGSLRLAALDGSGITLLPSFLVGEDIRAGRLTPVLTDWELPAIPIHAVYPANRNIARKVRALVALIAKRFADHPDLRLG